MRTEFSVRILILLMNKKVCVNLICSLEGWCR